MINSPENKLINEFERFRIARSLTFVEQVGRNKVDGHFDAICSSLPQVLSRVNEVILLT
jgi:hypothetical protein